MKPSHLLYAIALLFPTSPLCGQAGTPERTDSNLTLLDLTIDPTVNEPYRIFLAKGIVYRASFDQPGITMRMRSYQQRQLPFLVPVTQTDDASGRSEYELYPQADGEIEFLAVFNELQVPVHFRLWSDSRATARGRRSAEEGYWEIGFEAFGAGYGSTTFDKAPTIDPVSSFGGCFAFRNGPGALGRLNGCAFGMEVFGGDGDIGDRSRFFIEPRFRVTGGSSQHTGVGLEAGLLLAVTFAEAGINYSPGIYGAADYRGQKGSGWRLLVALRTDHQRAEVFDDPSQPWLGTHDETAWTPSLRLGLGYYW